MLHVYMTWDERWGMSKRTTHEEYLHATSTALWSAFSRHRRHKLQEYTIFRLAHAVCALRLHQASVAHFADMSTDLPARLDISQVSGNNGAQTLVGVFNGSVHVANSQATIGLY